MPRKKAITNSTEALNSKVNKSGAGEDAVVKDLMQGKMATASDSEALTMALALQKILKGQDSILEMQKNQGELISKLQAEAAKRDEADRQFKENQEKFLQDVMERAENLKVKGDALDKIKANAANDAATAYKSAMAQAKADNLKFEQDLATMKKVTITSGGVPVLTTEGGRPAVKLMPEEVHIKHKTWRLQPGVPQEVPEVVAKVLEDRRKGQAQTQKLERALQSDLEMGELNRKMREIRSEAEAPFDPNQLPPETKEII